MVQSIPDVHDVEMLRRVPPDEVLHVTMLRQRHGEELVLSNELPVDLLITLGSAILQLLKSNLDTSL